MELVAQGPEKSHEIPSPPSLSDPCLDFAIGAGMECWLASLLDQESLPISPRMMQGACWLSLFGKNAPRPWERSEIGECVCPQPLAIVIAPKSIAPHNHIKRRPSPARVVHFMKNPTKRWRPLCRIKPSSSNCHYAYSKFCVSEVFQSIPFLHLASPSFFQTL
jgi:hypothetical protein